MMNENLPQTPNDNNGSFNPKKANKPKKSKLKTSLKWLLISICSVLLLLILCLIILLYTTTGARIAHKVTIHFVPELKMETISGTLHDLTLENVTYTQAGIEIKVKKAHLSFSPVSLLKGKLIVDQIQIDDVFTQIETDQIERQTTVEEPVASDETLIKLPLSIIVKNLTLDQIQAQIDDSTYRLAQLKSQLNWQGSLITVSDLKVNGVQATLPTQFDSAPAIKTVAKKEKINIKQMMDSLFAKPIIQVVPKIFIPVNVDIQSAEFTQVEVIQSFQSSVFSPVTSDQYDVEFLNLSALLNDQLLTIKQLSTQFKSPFVTGELSLLGSLDFTGNWQTDLKMKGKLWVVDKFLIDPPTDFLNTDQTSDSTGVQQSIDQATDQPTQADLTYELQGFIFAKSQHHLQIEGRNDLDLKAQVDLSQPFLPMSLTLESDHVQWPLFVQKPKLKANQTQLQLHGALNDYALFLHSKLEAAIEGTNQLDSVLELYGTDESLTINNLQLTLLAADSGNLHKDLSQGNMNLNATLNWHDLLDWDAHLNFDNFDLSQFSSELTTKLKGTLKTHGFIDLNALEEWQFVLNDLNIEGVIRKKPIILKGNLTATPDQIESKGLDLTWGKNKITVSGDTQKHLITMIQLPELNLFSPELSGQIKGELVLNGEQEQYSLKSNLAVNQLKWETFKLAQLTLKNQLNFANEKYAGDLQIQGQNLAIDDLKLDRFNLNLKGEEALHHLNVTLQSDLLKALIQIDGGLNADRTNWKGNIKTAHLSQPIAGQWRLNHAIPVDVQLEQVKANIGAFCLVNRNQTLCLDEPAEIGQSGQATLSLNNLMLGNYLNPLMQEYSVRGALNLKAQAHWDESMNLPEIQATLQGNKIRITELITLERKSKVIDQVKADIQLNSKQAKLDLEVLFNRLGNIYSQIVIDDPLNQKKLSGNLMINHLSLALLDLFLIDEEEVKGEIQGDLAFSGTLDNPKINGELDINVDQLTLLQVQTNIESIKTRIQFMGNKSSLTGVIKSPSGNIDLSGSSSWQNVKDWTADVSTKGGPIEVTVPEMVTLAVEPNIRVKASEQEIKIQGKVSIPTAKITIESLPPSVVSVSDDVVMLNENLMEITPKQFPIPINLAVLVDLGNDVVIDAYGLKANLSGDLLVAQSAKGMTGMGKITIPEGRFHAYGQDLIIRKGEFIFAGPLDNPNLNIEAIRNPESIANNVTAGIRITGFANNPQVNIFSEPSMSQQEALSYLFTGQGFDAETQNQNDMMAALLIGVGASQTGQYLGDVGTMFGVKDLTIDTVGVGNDQRVVVSGYLDPRLQLKYSVGIFDAITKYTMRYRLIPKLYLEVSSSLERTIDLIYQFEL